MVKENTFSKIEATIKDGGKMTWCMGKVSCFSLMENFSIKENGLMMSLTVGEFYMLVTGVISLTFGHAIKERWKMVRCMGEVNYTSLVALFLKGNSKMEKYLGVDVELIRMERWLRKSGDWWIYRHFWTKMITTQGILWD
jgi:hypothetical protein